MRTAALFAACFAVFLSGCSTQPETTLAGTASTVSTVADGSEDKPNSAGERSDDGLSTAPERPVLSVPETSSISATSTTTPAATTSSRAPSTGPATTGEELAAVTSVEQAGIGTTSAAVPGPPADQPAEVRSVGPARGRQLQLAIAVESHVADVSGETLTSAVLATLNDAQGWPRAGFSFVADPTSDLRVVLAEGAEVDRLCAPLDTGGTVSCQNGATVALNADRWRNAFEGWDSTVADYREYLVNHEVGHLLGQRHPAQRCPHPGATAGLMEPQTGGLKGCIGNGWPRDWEIVYASERPVTIGPLPSWTPPHKPNLEPANS